MKTSVRWSGSVRKTLLLGFAFASLLHAQDTTHVSNHDHDRAQHAFLEGAKAVSANNLQEAVKAFTQATALDPSDRDYEAALAIARDNYATQLMQQALKARLLSDNATWRARTQEAAAQDSRNPLVLEHQKELVDDLRSDKPAEDAVLGQVGFDAGPPVELAPEKGTHSFHLMLPKGDVLRQVLSAYGITPILDKSVGTERVHFDGDDLSFAEAEQMLNLATGTFVVPLDPQRALLALDTKENRTNYQRMAFETIYLPGLTSAEMTDVGNIARNVFEAQQATVHESSGTLTVRAPALRMQAFNYEVNELLAGRGEVVVDVDIYETQHQKMVNEGATLPQTTTLFNLSSELNTLVQSNSSLVQEIISSGLASPGNIEEIAVALLLSGQAGSSILSQPFAYFGGGLTATGLTLTSAAANLQYNTTDTRLLDKVQLRLNDQEEGSVKIGERYPIVTSSYSNLATGSTSIAGITSAGLSNTLQNLGVNLASLSAAATASVPQVQYQDIGLVLTATPRVQQGQDVGLKLQLQLSSLSGTIVNGNPIINNRQSTSSINVRPGEKTVLFSQLSNEEDRALIGLPFLSEIPGLEFGTNRQITDTVDDLIVILTPHVVRLTHTHTEGQMVLLPTHS